MNDQPFLPSKPLTSTTTSNNNNTLSITSSSIQQSNNNNSSYPSRTQSVGNIHEGYTESNFNGGTTRATFASPNTGANVRPSRLPTGNINHQNMTPNFYSTTIPTTQNSFIPHTQQMFMANNEKIERLIKATFQTQQVGLSKTISFLQSICSIEEIYQQKIASECASSNFEVHFPGEIGQMLACCRSFFYKNAKSSERFAQDVRTCLCEPLSQINKEISKKKKMVSQTHEAICKSHQNYLTQLQSKKKTNESKRQNLENAEKKWKLSLSQTQSEKSSSKESSFFSSLINNQLNPEQTKAKYEQSLEEYSESEIELQQTKQKYETLVKSTLYPQCKTIAEKTTEQYVETGTIIHLYIQHLTKLLEARAIEAQNNLAAFREIVDSMNVEDIQNTLIELDVNLDEEPKKKQETHSPNSSPPSEKPRPSTTTPIFSVYSQERDENTIFFDEMLSEIISIDESDDVSPQTSPITPTTEEVPITDQESINSKEKETTYEESINSKEQEITPEESFNQHINSPPEETTKPTIPKKRPTMHKDSNVDNSPQFVNYMNKLTEAKEKINSSEECRIAFCKVLNQKRSKSCFKKFFYFQDLAELIGDCLNLAHTQNDRNVGRLLLNMTQTFYYYGIDYPTLEEEKDKPKEKKKIFVYSILDDMPCWQDLRFWEFCLYDALNTEKLSRISNNNASLTEEQIQAEHENIVFGLLSSFCFTMNEMHIPQDIIKKFAEKMCDINSLNEDYRTMIMSVVASEINESSEHHVKMSRYRSKRKGVLMTDEQLSQLRNEIRRESTIDINDE